MKRLLLGALALLVSIAASATTLNPIQLLNPAGSSSGQAIVSTGASTAPGWGNVPVANVTGAAALAGATFTGAISAPGVTALSGNIQASSGNFLGNGNGFTIGNTTGLSSGGAVQIFDATHGNNVSVLIGGSQVANFTSTGINSAAIGSTTAGTGKFTTLQATGAITPSTTAGIVGTTLADNATAGSVGEYISNSATGVAQTSATLTNVTSVSLTAGDWDLGCAYALTPAGSTTTQGLNFGLTTTSAGQAPVNQRIILPVSLPAGAGGELECPTVRLNVSSTTTVFLTAAPTFSVSTATSGGFIWARRRR